jgi:2-dehydro-3-deoxygluconokinase
VTDAALRLDVVGVGEAMVLLEPPPGTTLVDASSLDVHVAGAEFNACAAIAALGGRSALATRLGDDPLGARVRATGERHGVRIEASRDPARPTGMFIKDPDAGGGRRVFYYRAGSAASALGAADAERVLDLKPRAILLSGLTAALGPGPEALVRELAVRAAGIGARVAVDVNLRPTLGRLHESVATLRAILPHADLLVLGTDESAALFGTEDPAAIAAAARAAGCREVVVKAGADGCHWFDEGGHPQHLPSMAITVVDAVGAGDAFTGAYLWSRLLGLPAGDAAAVASRLAAVVVASPGDVDAYETAPVRALRDDLAARARPTPGAARSIRP